MDHSNHECSGHCTASSVTQTLSELDFERGIWSAALNGDLEDVKRHLSKDTDVDKRDNSGYTALHYASRNGHLNVVRVLVDARANVNAVTKSGEATALHRCAYMGHTDILKYLLSRGAIPTSRDTDGMTPLHKAAERNRLDCVKLLLEAAPTAKDGCDNRGRTPLNCATNEEVKRSLT